MQGWKSHPAVPFYPCAYRLRVGFTGAMLRSCQRIVHPLCRMRFLSKVVLIAQSTPECNHKVPRFIIHDMLGVRVRKQKAVELKLAEGISMLRGSSISITMVIIQK
jgi:hypothetical protein